jgi:hypothetical protein
MGFEEHARIFSHPARCRPEGGLSHSAFAAFNQCNRLLLNPATTQKSCTIDFSAKVGLGGSEYFFAIYLAFF